MKTALGTVAGAALAAAFFLSPSFAAAAAEPVATNDTFGSKQWYLDAIRAREGWNVSTGSRDVVVAVIDSGVDIAHPDLKGNIWANPNETAGNGADDDGNGFVDDVNGWNFVSDSADVRPVPSADGLVEAWIHGTVVASLIAAGGNDDIGISGVAWKARLMPLVVLGSDGYGRDEDIIRAIRYAVAHGADIINLSLVGYSYNGELDRAVREATSQGVLVVSAAGNSENDPAGEDMDGIPGYPACDKGAAGRGAITVTALTRTDRKAPYANFGTCVDVSAPGADLFAARPATDPFHPEQIVAGYAGELTGTSIAAPLVSGLAALLKAKHPSWQAPEIAERIIKTSDPVTDPDYPGMIGRGRINVERALEDDAPARRLGPLYLEAADAGRPPEIRVLTAEGAELHRFPVGEAGDKRGVRASFLRWQGNAEPDIAISMIGDDRGAWRIYRPDGQLIAAGEQGPGVRGGLALAAQDLDMNARDTLLLGEADGRRAWLVSADAPSPREIQPFHASSSRGIAALSVTRPTPSFLISPKYGEREIVIVGQGGSSLAEATAKLPSGVGGWLSRRAERKGGGAVYDLVSPDGRLVFVNDASGLSLTKDAISITRWAQEPEGEVVNKGWRFYESWPR